MDFLSNLVQQVITILYNFTASLGIANYGLAIILLTIIVKLLLYPLTKKQIQSTKAMMKLQPKMKAIQEQYKHDKMEMNKRLADLYKTEDVNPVAGCLPLLVQMPIFIGIYYGIRDFKYVGPTLFLGVDITKSAMEMYSAAGLQGALIYFVLPILSVITTYVQSKQTMPDTSSPQNKIMLNFMPLFMGYLSFTFPTGLVLYWVVMNLMQIAQQAILNKESDK
ncbi:MAG: YidC/Oxa1 family membrane protein insertase [Acidaminococcaceae bacterium]|nr:YidC/Oxa1 family membrane protein insertase [Acidaminococcaceae bacterium]